MFKNDRNLLIIALIAVVNALGYGIIIPIQYAYGKSFGLSDLDTGLLFSLFSIGQFVSTPIIGRLSDKYGRRPLLIGSIAGTAVSFFMMAFAPNALFLFLARALDGITAGNIPVASAVISDTTTPENRAKGFGIIGAAFGFGFVFGPAISGFTVGISHALPFLIAGAVSLVAVIITAIYLPETNKHIGEVKHEKLFNLSALWHSLFAPATGIVFLITLFYFLAFACAIIYGFQPFTQNVLGITTTQNAFLFTLFGIIGLFSQLFLVQRFAKRFGLKNAFSVAIFITAIAFLVMFFSRSLSVFIAASVLLGLFNGFAQTLIPTILSRETDVKSQGSMLGLNASYQSIGMIIGPILGGALATISTPVPFIAGFLILLVCFILSFKVKKPGVHKESAF
jgi:MFS family permease